MSLIIIVIVIISFLVSIFTAGYNDKPDAHK